MRFAVYYVPVVPSTGLFITIGAVYLLRFAQAILAHGNPGKYVEVISRAQTTCTSSTKGSKTKRAHRVMQGYYKDFLQPESSPVRVRSPRTN